MAPSYLASVVGVLFLAGLSGAGVCPTPGVTGTQVQNLIAGVLQAWTCPQSSGLWSTGDSVLLVGCNYAQATTSNETCSTTRVSCSGSPPSIANTTHVALTSKMGYYYDCNNGTSWISGSLSGHISQCLSSGNYSNIFDFCVPGPACILPRDCSALMDIGMNISGLFIINPIGLTTSPTVTVMCDLAEGEPDNVRMSDGGWTLLLQHKSSDGAMAGDFIGGFSSSLISSNSSYFLGSTTLLNLGSSDCQGCRPLVLKVLLDDSQGMSYHTTYFGVTVNTTSSGSTVLTSTGGCHGNAGDGLMLETGQEFVKKADSTYWWGQAANLTGSVIQWGPLANKTISRVMIWFRSEDYDQRTSCPPLLDADPGWNYTEVDMTVSRSPGSIFSYQCTNQYMMEGQDGDTRSSSGAIECTATPSFNALNWNDTCMLPCTLVCPDGWFKSRTKTECYQFNSSITTYGIISSALQCHAVNGSLAVIVDTADLSTANQNQYYYTAHTQIGSSAGSVSPSTTVADTLACTTDCSATAVKECLVVSNSSRKYVMCNDTTMYSMCMVPAYCPGNYTEYRGLCYNITTSATDDLSMALSYCNKNGAALAYPQDLDTLNYLSLLVQVAASSANITLPADVMVGVNNIWGNWTSSMYNVSSDLVTAAENPSKSPGWRLMTVPAAPGNASFKVAQLSGNGAKIAICQFLGPIGCWDLPLDPAGNMTRSSWNWTMTALNTSVTYTCYPGYFIGGNITQSTLTVGCLGQLGGWYPKTLSACSAVEVCLQQPIAPSPLITNTTSSNWGFLNGTVNFTCPALMATEKNVTVQTLTCSNNNGSYSFMPGTVDPCNVCLGQPAVGNAVTNWSNSTVWKINMTVTATCNANYVANLMNNTIVVNCTDTGWDKPPACYQACTADPPNAGTNMVRSNYTSNAVNTVISYTCSSGLYAPTNKNYTTAMAVVNVTCSNSSQWVTQGPALWCTSLCLSNPVPAPTLANSSWDGYSRTNGSIVVYSCNGSLVFGDLSSTLNVTCENGTWTPINQTIFICRLAVKQLPPALPVGAALPGMNSSTSSTYNTTQYWAGDTINITCEPGTISPTRQTYISTTSNGTAWSPLDPAFVCLPIIKVPPPSSSNGVVMAGPPGPYWVGQTLVYTCISRLVPSTTYTYINVTNNGTQWSPLDPNFICHPPSSGLLYPPLPDFPVAYAQTATYYWGTIDNNMTWVPSTPPVPQIKGPFGFGTGVNMSISRHQCLVHKGYNVTVDQCSANPANCTLGFSLSVWINVNITQNYFDSINDTTGHLTTFQTIVSTGGDTNGHPGVRLSLYGVWIYALLSTGNLYWEASTIGQFGTRNWTNIGIRWAPPSLNDSGLEVFVNQKKQAQTMSPQTAAASKSALNPPQMMVGCHMDADNTTYRNYADALIDELATWTKELNDTETLYFTGGYAWEFANQTAESFASQVSGADMNDPETAATVINGLQNMIADQTTQNSMPSPTQATSATTAGTQASPTAVPPTTALTDFQTLLNVVNTITKGGNAPQNITATQCNKILSLYGAVSNLFSVNNVGNIEAIQERKDNAGSAQVMENVANWTSALIRQVRYVNTTIPLNFTQVTDNILMMAIKRNLSEWRASGQAFIVSPNYSTLSLSSLWDYPYDRAAVPVGLVSDPDCGNRAINVQVISSRTYDLTAFTLVNVARMPDSDYYEVGSHTLTVRVDCDPPTTNNTNYTKAADECQPTPEALLNNPIRLKLRHTIVESYVTRSLKFHDQERKKTILHRYCVWWNPALSDFGVWDSTGCYILETTDKYTKCACAQLGTFAIMALQTEPKVVPVDAVWLTVLRYIGYGLSFLFIIIYILVVAFSSDLKDQFHLMGANLAVGVLMGTVFMVVSDLNSVRSSRHSCTAVGTLLHLFYQGAGAAVFTLGHASFNAITSGVIGGLLRAYLPISWGLPLISVGLTYLLFLFDLGEDPRCFISWENSPKYVFFGFQMFFVFFSFIHASIVLCNVSTPALRKDNLIDDYGSFCRGAAYVTLFFDLTWVFGLLCYLHLGFTEPDFYPIFQVLNSWTGLVVFLFIGMGSRRFKMVVAGQAHLRRQMLFGNAFGTSSAVPEYKEVLNTPEDEYNGAIESTPSDKSSPVTNSQLQVQRAQDKAPFLPPPSPVPGQID